MPTPAKGRVEPDSSSVGLERLKAFPAKLRVRGLFWLVKRLWREIFVPTTRPTRIASGKLAQLHRLARSGKNATPNDLLPAFYDLDVNPITFDFAWFLVSAEMAARRAKKAGFLLILVPGTDDGLREEIGDYAHVVDISNRKWRIDNVLLPLARLSSACRGIVICANRRQADAYLGWAGATSFPTSYQSMFPHAFDYSEFFATANQPGCFEGLRASEQGLRHVQAWAEQHAPGRRLITVTLRNYRYQPSRNNDMTAWSQFLRGLDQTIYAPVIVPDTDSAFEPLPEFEGTLVFAEAAWNVGLRMALYEAAFANLFVNNGPAALAQLNPACVYLYTKILVPDLPQATEQIFRDRGIEPGQSPRFATPTQIWWWKDDTRQNLQDGFRLLLERIEAGGNGRHPSEA